jgi:uncharacterized protein (TIGR00375 family)
MSWVADLHIHSHFSMATSKEGYPANLYRWAALKGVALVGTGDFTHPGWRTELRDNLLPAEAGFYRLRQTPAPEIPGQPEVRFVVTGELSTIYKKNGRTRKVHHLVVLPSLEAADRISSRLEALGMNIRSDGRPILGLDSYLLLQLILELAPDAIFIPAHIWTPHFSVFGSNSGFNDLAECYEDLTPQIHALETGLSSDPAMNWRWSALDRFNLVSNSDAHNPQNLAREANLFTAEFSYPGLKTALETRDSAQFDGTLEFFPEEGKYHWDGHRQCQICWDPEETRRHGGICPVCGRKVTMGVSYRLAELADRPDDFRPENAKPYLSLVPLREIIGAALNVGSKSQKVMRIYWELLRKFGPELEILTRIDPELLGASAGSLVATGIQRLRKRQVNVRPGYDGEYGVVSLFNEEERRAILGQNKLFIVEQPKKVVSQNTGTGLAAAEGRTDKDIKKGSVPVGVELSPEQQQVVRTDQAVLRVIAGPGTGKTRTLVERIAYLIREGGADPATITAVTFTNKAAAEIKARVERLLAGITDLKQLQIGTFHSLAWRILNSDPDGPPAQLLDRPAAENLLQEVLQETQISLALREAIRQLGLVKNKYLWEDPLRIDPTLLRLYRAYQQKLAFFQRWDFDDILVKAVELWDAAPEWLKPYRRRFTHLLVDEFQDVNPLQYQLVSRWAKDSRSLMVIGDPNQAIYGFRGSDSHFFADFQRDLAEAVSMRLTQNYRSTATVIAAANSLIAPEFRQAVCQADHHCSKITWLRAPEGRQAAQTVTETIVGLIGGSTMISAGGRRQAGAGLLSAEAAYSFSDIAILYRTGRQAEALEAALNTVGLPYRVVGSVQTLEAESVKSFLSFCRYLNQPDDPYWLRDALFQNRWGLDRMEQAQVNAWFGSTEAGELPQGEYLERIRRQADGRLLAKIHAFELQTQEFRSKLTQGVPELITAWIAGAALPETLELEHFSRLAVNYTDLPELLHSMPLATDADLSRSNQIGADQRELLTLSTIHASKGLEFPVVLIVGVEEGLIPYGTSDPAELAEEQRLFYVALTRTRERCYLVSSNQQYRNGELIPTEPSRYLKLFPEELLKVTQVKARPVKDKQLELF